MTPSGTASDRPKGPQSRGGLVTITSWQTYDDRRAHRPLDNVWPPGDLNDVLLGGALVDDVLYSVSRPGDGRRSPFRFEDHWWRC
jgi:hypothetical protein